MSDRPQTPANHPEQLRRRALAAAPGSPWVTYYDAATGSRVELSAATLDNWVAKAGNLLVEEYDVGPGSVVGIELPCHWLLHVWTWSAWAVGATVALPATWHDADVVIGTMATAGGSAAAAPVLVCPTDPLARPLGGRTPPGAVDVMADVHTYPDAIALPTPDPAAIAVRSADGGLTGAHAVDLARELLPSGTRRVLVTEPPTTVAALLAATLSGAAAGGSTVLVAGAPGSEELDRIADQEGVDARLRNQHRP